MIWPVIVCLLMLAAIVVPLWGLCESSVEVVK